MTRGKKAEVIQEVTDPPEEAKAPVDLAAEEFSDEVKEDSVNPELAQHVRDLVGLFVQHGTLLLEDVTVTGHEYGLQGLEATVEGRGFTSVRASRAGVALIGSRGTLEETVVQGSGSFGALSLVGYDEDEGES